MVTLSLDPDSSVYALPFALPPVTWLIADDADSSLRAYENVPEIDGGLTDMIDDL